MAPFEFAVVDTSIPLLNNEAISTFAMCKRGARSDAFPG